MEQIYQYDLNEKPEQVTANLLKDKDVLKLDSAVIIEEEFHCTVALAHRYNAVYGLGERFDGVNQKGHRVTTEVMEQFCNQGNISYCPIPFFFTDQKIGVYVDTYTVTEFIFEDEIQIKIKKDSSGRLPVITFFMGSPASIISCYSELTGRPQMVPKWSFGPWMSANRWNNEKEIRQQLENVKKYNFPHSVMVIEAWSDEATFYRFNDKEEWTDPRDLVQTLLENGIRLILWQIPVIKKMEDDQINDILEEDWKYAVENNLCIKNPDGTPYTIPKNHWFAGSLIPDFTREEAVNWWFEKRKYLLEMGVSGFKTDGGEFVLTDDVKAANGCTGLELRNLYAASYVEAYSRFIGKDRVLFSRAGYTRQQHFPMQWAGDQMSTWEEFKHVVSAGLSIGLSGVPFWGFDIAGFAGPMPSLDLYIRATQLAVFAPVMQWHSEPDGGQFADILSTNQGINERSPWNISRFYGDETILERLRFHYFLRMNLLPYLYNLALDSSKTGLPMMKHLILEYPEDERVFKIEDCFMLGDILAAPILEEGKEERMVYLPEGTWISLWQEDYLKLEGGKSYRIQSGKDRIPVFLREGGCIALNLGNTLEPGTDVGNQLLGYSNLCFYVTGEKGEYHFRDDENNEILLSWKNKEYRAERVSGNAEFKVIFV
ncbi:glycoside hydrolase family 31 protein [Anaerocolumna xylanovorans]|uniref:Alpha-D-xyloside xylohydrolase n=1 Tax=Anaerocolumna xylanovorans DSM 12503 TaxID=1121345 RepID=A0A1M7Y4S2_9FIRM|nr:TIM-barrel domain-containing protein [Anaerocolumna xylanovorans]SHO47359.1 alpha-D-xyloside xylohydrolase [Anaerocolumna xylanovorans DSM 12503]